MLDVKLFQSHTFLPLPYEAALGPRLKRAHEKLQTDSGTGGERTGWVRLPRDYDQAELAVCWRPRPASRAIPRLWWSPVPAGPAWEPGA